ncbi:hypothetical protein HOY80DRAFT_644183 [Tuber brumale]|nr:hypothetical protein HOY80DRAFT_644183 [Tuber brumale]
MKNRIDITIRGLEVEMRLWEMPLQWCCTTFFHPLVLEYSYTHSRLPPTRIICGELKTSGGVKKKSRFRVTIITNGRKGRTNFSPHPFTPSFYCHFFFSLINLLVQWWRAAGVIFTPGRRDNEVCGHGASRIISMTSTTPPGTTAPAATILLPRRHHTRRQYNTQPSMNLHPSHHSFPTQLKLPVQLPLNHYLPILSPHSHPHPHSSHYTPPTPLPTHKR